MPWTPQRTQVLRKIRPGLGVNVEEYLKNLGRKRLQPKITPTSAARWSTGLQKGCGEVHRLRLGEEEAFEEGTVVADAFTTDTHG